ncbi:unnamed protein product [Amoebophrya sp. A120]|nr:unnamed protein product [Amoebophrya sp. A120]|eukprot:GSA120T00011545001.1
MAPRARLTSLVLTGVSCWDAQNDPTREFPNVNFAPTNSPSLLREKYFTSGGSSSSSAGGSRASNAAGGGNKQGDTNSNKHNHQDANQRRERRAGARDHENNNYNNPFKDWRNKKPITELELSPEDIIQRRALRQAAIEFSNRKMFAKYGHARKYLNPRMDEPGQDEYLSPDEVAALSLQDFTHAPGEARATEEKHLGAAAAAALQVDGPTNHDRSSDRKLGIQEPGVVNPDGVEAGGGVASPDVVVSASSASSSVDQTEAVSSSGTASSREEDTSASAQQQQRQKLFESVVHNARASERKRMLQHKPAMVKSVTDIARQYLSQIVETAATDASSPNEAGETPSRRSLGDPSSKTAGIKNSAVPPVVPGGLATSRRGYLNSLVEKTLSVLEKTHDDREAHKDPKTSSSPAASTSNIAARPGESGSDYARRLQAEVDGALNTVVSEEERQTAETASHDTDYKEIDRSVFYSQLAEVEAVLRHLTTGTGSATTAPPGGAVNATSTTTTTTLGCIRNCCEDVKISVRILADEYMDLGLGVNLRQTWSDLSKTECQKVDCQCEMISDWVETQCIFYVSQIITSGTEVQNYCTGAGGTRSLFEKAYCPAACLPVDCNDQQGQQCMGTCGDFLDCRCSNRLGGSKPPRCEGLTEITKEPCYEPPGICAMHTPSVGQCAPYHFCPKNLCNILNVVCVPDDMCQGDGICIPSTGQCVYPNLAKGTPCEDNIFYTYNKTCNGMGTCVGLVNMCQQHNIQCRSGVPDCTFLPGNCQPETGRCVYDFKPDDTECDDARPYTVGDQCQKGLCVGTIVDLCASVDCAPVQCQDEGTCHDTCFGTCDKSTGACIYPRKPNGVPCNDRQPDIAGRKPVCIDGVCVGDPYFGNPQYRTVGEGQCVDNLGFRMNAQQGDVGEEKECKRLCTMDNQCKGYSFAFPVCTLFGTVRSTTDMPGWNMLEGDQTPALEIEQVLKPRPGEPQFVCRKKAFEGDPESVGFTALSILIGWGGFSTIFSIILIFYFRVTIWEAMLEGKDAFMRRKDAMMEKYRAGRQVDPYFGEEVELEMVKDRDAQGAIQDTNPQGEVVEKKARGRKIVQDDEGNEYSVSGTPSSGSQGSAGGSEEGDEARSRSHESGQSSGGDRPDPATIGSPSKVTPEPGEEGGEDQP